MGRPRITPSGYRRSPEEGWEEFDRKVEEAAAKRRAHARRHGPLENLKVAGRFDQCARAPRCIATAKAGHQCGQPAVRGAERCAKHGGLLEVPHHKANTSAKGLAAMERRKAAFEAVAAFRALPSSIQRQAIAVHHQAAEGVAKTRTPWTTLLATALAIQADPTGKSLFRTIQAHRDKGK